MVRVSPPAKLRPWSELTAQNGDGGGSCVGDVCRVNFARKIISPSYEFSYEKCSDIFPEIFEPLFCGSEKIPENSLQISH